jgi:hypothetical protein
MFDRIVRLYRLLGKPPLDEACCFVTEADGSQELRSLLEELGRVDPLFGRYDHRERGGKIRVEAALPQNSEGHFFASTQQFIESTASLKRGDFRKNFYIVDLDYLSGEDDPPDAIARVRRLTEFIHCLREFVSLSIDREQSMNGDRLIFLKPSDGKSPQKAAVLKVDLTSNAIALKLSSFRILSALKAAQGEEKTRIEERILLMNTAIAQTIDECDGDEVEFEYLVKNWGKVTKRYLHDLHAYVSAFSFDSVRKKISDSLIESTTKINNAVGDVATKLLAVPASLGALIVIGNASSTASFAVGIVGVVVASLIILRTVWHYQKQVHNLAESFKFNMEEATKAKKTFSKPIKEEIQRIERVQREQNESIRRSFFFYYAIAWLPIAGCIYYVVDGIWPVLLHRYSLYKYCLPFGSG